MIARNLIARLHTFVVAHYRYYYNSATGKTTWTKPAALGGAAAAVGGAGLLAAAGRKKKSSASDREHAQALALARQLRGQNAELRSELKRVMGRPLSEPPPPRQPNDLHAEVVAIRMQNKSIIKQLRTAKKQHQMHTTASFRAKKKGTHIHTRREYRQRRNTRLSVT